MDVDKQWLVKTGDAIIGPFPFDEVVEKIFAGEMNLIDEIQGPFERWRPIRDHSLFAAAIEKFKATAFKARDMRENTVTSTMDIGTQTELTNNETISSTIEQETAKFDATLPGVDIPDLQELREEPVRRPANRPTPPPPGPTRITHQSPPPTTASARRSSMGFILSFLLIVGGITTYLVYEFRQTKLIEQKISAFAQLTDKALDYMRVGEYQKSLRSFNLAHSISPNDPNLLVEMSPLSVQLGGQWNETRDRMVRLLAINKQKTIRKKAYNIIGLAYSYEGRLSEALTSFNNSLRVDSHYVPAILNKAFTLMRLKKADEASSLLLQTVNENRENSLARFLYIRSLLNRGSAAENTNAFREVILAGEQYLERFPDFRQEVLFVIALAKLAIGVPVEELVGVTRALLSVDLELTNLHVHDPDVDFQIFGWSNFSVYCNRLAGSLPAYESKLVAGFCQLKIGQMAKAKITFDSLLSKYSGDGVLQALKASTLLRMNDLSQAKNALSILNQVQEKNPLVEAILRGCLAKEDLNCARSIFAGEHANLISPLYQTWGKAAVSYKQSRSQAKSFIDRGLSLSPDFGPLLKIRKRY